MSSYYSGTTVSPLMAAIDWNVSITKKALIELLLSSGARVDFKDEDGSDALLYLASSFCSGVGIIEGMGWLEMLVDKGSNVNTSNNYGITPLMHIARCGGNEEFNYLINNNANIYDKNSDGKTVLMYAACDNRLDDYKVRRLLEKGAEVNARDNRGQTALYYATKCNISKIIKAIVQFGGTF